MRDRGRGRSGLGLAVTKGLIEGHDGRIWNEETPGGGATFVFDLPLGAGAPPPASNAESLHPISVGSHA